MKEASQINKILGLKMENIERNNIKMYYVYMVKNPCTKRIM
jgi:hypothetical protein